jgi:uncharacterized protein
MPMPPETLTMHTSSPLASDQSDVTSIKRPSSMLLAYYLLVSLLSGPLLIFAVPAVWIRYNTLRYRLEETGIRMTVGLIFRKEVVVAFRRIQDIHVSRNLLQRWLGIASVSIQTASGNAMPEIVLEGMEKEEAVRDWLYQRMRGARGIVETKLESNIEVPISTDIEIGSLLRDIRDNLAVLAGRLSINDDRRSSQQGPQV